MGRSVEVPSNALRTAELWLEDDFVSVCFTCDHEVKRSYDGEMIWVDAYPAEGQEASKFCGPEHNIDIDGESEPQEHTGWDYDSDTWAEDIGFYMDRLQELFPSLYEVDGSLSYPYRETSVKLQNSLVQVVVSEYCGLTAISMVPREDDYGVQYPGLVARWTAQTERKWNDLFGVK